MSPSNFKIFHGPSNICGIGGYLSSYQKKEKGVVSDFITYFDFTKRQNHDLNLHIEKYCKLTKLIIIFTFFFLALIKYNIFHFQNGTSLLPLNLDLPILKLFRKKIIMTYCGSDIRLVSSVESKRCKYWKKLTFKYNNPKQDKWKIRMMRWHRIWIDRFTAPRNLFAHANYVIPKKRIEKDIWLNNIMYFENYPKPDYKPHDVPVIIHAPSNRDVKGTKYVLKAIENLKKKSLKFTFKLLEGVPNDEAQKIIQESDIILDQFIIGGFGTLAVEGMTFGKVVLTYLIDDPDGSLFHNVPIVNTNLDNLEEKIEWCIKNPDERVKIGKEGRKYVEKHFDAKDINERIWEMYKRL